MIKRWLPAVLLAFTLMPAMSAPEVSEWATAISKQRGTDRAIVFRYAKSFREGFRRKDFAVRVILVWTYRSETGMPMSDERAAMDRMEDLLQPAVEKSAAGVLSLVSTGEGLREWTYYVRSESVFMGVLNEALAGEGPFPIEIHVAPDAEWATYERFSQGVRE